MMSAPAKGSVRVREECDGARNFARLPVASNRDAEADDLAERVAACSEMSDNRGADRTRAAYDERRPVARAKNI